LRINIFVILYHTTCYRVEVVVKVEFDADN